jgi:putative DNA primase/helicase
MIKETIGEIPNIEENVPQELTERPQWVCWRLEERQGKLTKVPYTPDGSRASSTNLKTWSTFDEAMNAYELAGYDGVGFVFSSGDPYVGIDLDKCRDPETGEIAPWAQKIIDRVCEGYSEVSPSGTGVHIIVEGVVRDGGRSRRKVHLDGKVVGEIEMYSRGRFFTITGEVL